METLFNEEIKTLFKTTYETTLTENEKLDKMVEEKANQLIDAREKMAKLKRLIALKESRRLKK